MKKFLIYALLLCAVVIPLHAEFNNGGLNSGWSNDAASENQQYTSPIIYVFYDSETCDDNCAPAIAAIESVYNEYFANEYQFFVIDYFDDGENNFIGLYNLNTPLAMVLQQVQDGQPTIFRKYSGLNDIFVEGSEFDYQIRDEIQNYFED